MESAVQKAFQQPRALDGFDRVGDTRLSERGGETGRRRACLEMPTLAWRCRLLLGDADSRRDRLHLLLSHQPVLSRPMAASPCKSLGRDG